MAYLRNEKCVSVCKWEWILRVKKVAKFTKELLASMPNIDGFAGVEMCCDIDTLFTKKRPCNAINISEKPQGIHRIISVVAADLAFLISTIQVVMKECACTPVVFSYQRFSVTRTSKGGLQTITPYTPKASGKGFTTEVLAVVVMAKEQSNERQRSSGCLGVHKALKQRFKLLEKTNANWTHITAVMAEVAPVHAHGKAYLAWLRDTHFSFFGCAYTDMKVSTWKNPAGILDDDTYAPSELLAGVTQKKRKEVLGNSREIIFCKSSLKSPLHRYVPMDMIFIPLKKSVNQPHDYFVLVGLYTSPAYTVGTRYIPYISENISTVISRLGLGEGWHDGKWLHHMYDSLPRDEIFQSNIKTLTRIGEGVMAAKNNRNFGLIITHDSFGRYTNLLAMMPQQNFDTRVFDTLRKRIEDTLKKPTELINAAVDRYALAFVHYRVASETVSPQKVRAHILDHLKMWQDKIDALLSQDETLNDAYRAILPNGFSRAYEEVNSPETGVCDLRFIVDVCAHNHTRVNVWREDAGRWGIKIYTLNADLSLTEIISNLTNFGLRVSSESAYRIETSLHQNLWVHHLLATCAYDTCAVGNDVIANLTEALERRWSGRLDDSVANLALLSVNVTWRECLLMKCFLQYLKQLGFAYSLSSLTRIFTTYGSLIGKILHLFHVRHNGAESMSIQARIRLSSKKNDEICADLDALMDHEAERWLRGLGHVVMATVRTNFYKDYYQTSAGQHIALKVMSHTLPFLSEPRPFCEIFVYGDGYEGVHLRGGKVARGGIRWSDRSEDYRTEVYGLLKAQVVKNSVIVPVGSKGGFYVRRQVKSFADFDAYRTHAVACYKKFIRGLIGLTDNIVKSQSVPPCDIVCLDSVDSYLVVAADKGTATFSDYANEVALSEDYWLGDAFASGGAHGYDHKKLGITAKGAWVSVAHHLQKRGIDVEKDVFRVVGIGDMSGDVFGNGMLLSRKIALIGAFDHRHIFIDPDPNPEVSFHERQRLFAKGQSSWEEYNTKLISAGGGVFSRASKRIKLTPQMVRALNITDAPAEISADVLVKYILQAEVELLWFGGIGTFVCAGFETPDAVKDSANNAVRVFAKELRCKVIGEGANLGITQQGRIEFARCGGVLNTDSIDNSAGVNCSDYEVNIKILLGHEVRSGKITLKQRNALLAKMTDDVVSLVLKNNHEQNRLLSRTEREVTLHSSRVQLLIDHLESKKLIQSGRELANDFSLATITRPELSLIVAHAKNLWINHLLEKGFDHTPFVGFLERYFPPRLRKTYAKGIAAHPLAGNIVLTGVINTLINTMGLGFLVLLLKESGAPLHDCLLSWGMLQHEDENKDLIEDLNYSTVVQVACLYVLKKRNEHHACSIDDFHERYRLNLSHNVGVNDINALMIYYGLMIHQRFIMKGEVKTSTRMLQIIQSPGLQHIVQALIPEAAMSMAENSLLSHAMLELFDKVGAFCMGAHSVKNLEEWHVNDRGGREGLIELSTADRLVLARAYISHLDALK